MIRFDNYISRYIPGIILLAVLAPLATSCSMGMLAATRQTPACLPQDCLSAGRKAFALNERKGAQAALRALLDNYPSTVWSARASYLLGRDALADNPGAAIPLLTDAIALTSIEDHVLFNLGQAYFNSGDYNGAAAIYAAVIALYPDSVLTSASEFSRANALFASGGYKAARAAFEAFVASHPNDENLPDALLKSAYASVSLGEPDKAVAPVRLLNINYPADDTAVGAEGLAAMLDASGYAIPELIASEQFTRAQALFKGRRYNDAASAFMEITDAELRGKSVLRTAESLHRLRRYRDAEGLLNGFLDATPAPASDDEPRALALLAVSIIRQDNADGLARILARLSRYPLQTADGETMFAIARYYEGRGDMTGAVGLYTKLLTDFKGSKIGREAAWSMGWLKYRDKSFAEAFKLFSADCGPQAARCLYWSGRAAERAGMKKEAAEYYQATSSVTSAPYYRQMARARRSAAGTPVIEADDQRPVLPSTDVITGAFILDRHYLAARELMLLGLLRDSSTELDVVSKRYSSGAETAYALTRLFYASGDYYRGLKTYRSYLALGVPEKPDVLSMAALSMAYPAEVVGLARECSGVVRADPYLVASVMREESAFKPDAVSSVGAMGMMQLMPSTARFIARKSGEKTFETEQLLAAPMNIRLGSQYLSYLLDVFNGDTTLAVAAYNAGPGAVRRWTQEFTGEPDEFIETIPFPETREYTKRVIGSYGQYMRLFGAGPQDRISLSGQGGGASAESDAYRNVSGLDY